MNFTSNAATKYSIKLNKSSVTLYVNGTKTTILKATVTGKSKKVTWSSSNSKVASVKSGKVTAKKVGTATITAKANGKSTRCKIVVKKKSRPANYSKAMKVYRDNLWGEKFGVKDIMGDSIPEVVISLYDGIAEERQLWVYHYDPTYVPKGLEISEKFIANYIVTFEANNAIYVNKNRKLIIEYDKYGSQESYRVFDYKGRNKYDYDKAGNTYKKDYHKISQSTYIKEINSYLKGAKKYTHKDAKYTNNATNRKKYLS